LPGLSNENTRTSSPLRCIVPWPVAGPTCLVSKLAHAPNAFFLELVHALSRVPAAAWCGQSKDNLNPRHETVDEAEARNGLHVARWHALYFDRITRANKECSHQTKERK
jgi:hypothetical protein